MRAVGLGAEGCSWGGGCDGGAGRGGGAFRVGYAGVGGCCGAVLYGICCRICIVGAAFGFTCVAARGVGLRLLPSCCPRLHGFCDGLHGQRRADHGRACDRAEQVVKGSFHSGASR